MCMKKQIIPLLIFSMLFATCALGETSPTTGLPYPAERTSDYKPILVSMDNNYAAQVPSGLSMADIVYEYIRFGHSSTRFLALFNDVHPETVGPVVATQYFGADIRQEWDAPFVYSGGLVTTSEGETVIDVTAYLDAMAVPESLRFDATQGANDLFWREASMNPPQNLAVNLQKLANDRWPMDIKTDKPHLPSLPTWTFDVSYAENKDEPITSIVIDYAIHDYILSYQYNVEKRVYERQHNGSPVVDPLTQETVAASNVIVQYTEIVYKDNRASNPQIASTGEGKLDIFVHGNHFHGYWARKDINAKTHYYDDTGNELYFAPGRTFIQIVPEDAKITY